jgi:hypothetical protein
VVVVAAAFALRVGRARKAMAAGSWMARVWL